MEPVGRLTKSDSELVEKVCAGWCKQLKLAWKNLFEGGNNYLSWDYIHIRLLPTNQAKLQVKTKALT